MDYSYFVSLEKELQENKDKVDKALDRGDFSSVIELMDEGDFLILQGIIQNNLLISELQSGLKNIRTFEEHNEFQKLINSRKMLNEERISAFKNFYNLQNKYNLTNLAGNN